jgi:hypothetical protein
MFENLQSKLQNRNKSWDTIAYMTVVFKVGNEKAMLFLRVSCGDAFGCSIYTWWPKSLLTLAATR